MRILITGASGRIGGVARAGIAATVAALRS